MKKLILASVLAFSMTLAQAQDSWTSQDKYKHFGVSLALGVGASTLTDNKAAAYALALAPGVAKEFRDSRQVGNYFSYKDLVWDMAGVYLGVNTGMYLKKLPNKGVEIGWSTPF